ncbi:MAG TPA: FIST C-terminal domain-containing protein, partial [Ktedonobacterales bacterium]|nr:FIST C-terminal domain-containing protein [Ktedonobacterales bacterium]
LSLRTPDSNTAIVRAILAVDEDAQSMTFAGDMYEGAYARLMKANFDRLVVGAKGAAMTSYEAIGSSSPELAVLISCVGRKLVLKQRTEEEVEGVRNVLGEHTVLTGFYSYGEISPFTPGARCELHNQTMTITTFAEQ